MNPATARKIETAVLHRLADHGGAHISAATGLSESKISRLKTDHLADFACVLAALELKVVPSEMKCFRPDIVDAYRTLARANLEGAGELEVDE